MPTLPGWPEATITWHFGKTVYKIRIDNAVGSHAGIRRIKLDGTTVEGEGIPLVDDGKTHEIEVAMGS